MVNFLTKILGTKNDLEGKSYTHNDSHVLSVIKNENFPYFISFGRTGSHWIRMIMELYFERPSLTRIFYYINNTNYTCYHTHDTNKNLTVGNITCKNALYLYRNAPETIFSLLNYNKEDVNNTSQILLYSEYYGKHLKKWLLDEKFTQKKIIVKYENFKKNMDEEFKKICDFFSEDFNEQKLLTAANQVSKEMLKKKTKQNNQIVNLSLDYDDKRKDFLKKYSAIIEEGIWSVDPGLQTFFK